MLLQICTKKTKHCA